MSAGGGENWKAPWMRLALIPVEWSVIDVGASTGGFTDCVLQRGARKVYAVDVGYGQLAWKLQKDPRVLNLERRNIRYLKREEVDEEVDLILIDASFISIEKFLPHLLEFLKTGGAIISLIKPQFEVGKGQVGKGGVVKEAALHREVIVRLSAFCTPFGAPCPRSDRVTLARTEGEQRILHLSQEGRGPRVIVRRQVAGILGWERQRNLTPQSF